MVFVKTLSKETSENVFLAYLLRRNRKLAVFIAVFIAALFIIEIWVNNTMVIYGIKFEDISQLQKNITLENQLLENEIAKERSLINVASESASLGFFNPKDIKYIR